MIFHEFVSSLEAESIIKVAAPTIQPAVVGKMLLWQKNALYVHQFHERGPFCTVWPCLSLSLGGSKDVSEIRTSKNTWIEDGANQLVDKISLRMNRITGYQTIRKFDEFNEGKKDEYENLQVCYQIYNDS